MSEFAPSPERQEALPPPELAEPLRMGEASPEDQLEQSQIRDQLEQDARGAVEQSPDTDKARENLAAANAAPDNSEPVRLDRKFTLSHELKQIQRKLKTTDRSLSKVIHQPVVRAISETSGKTVARPSGLLGGGLVAFLGTSVYLFMARHIGLDYNYSVFLVLFFGGFAIGLGLELGVWAFTRNHSTAE